MSTEKSITHWLQAFKAGDATAANELWSRFFPRLMALARSKLALDVRAAADEEDVALSAFDSFCRGVEQGKFPDLDDRDNLWPLLVVLTLRKVHDLHVHEQRLKRGGEWTQVSPENEAPDGEFALSREPTPEFTAMMNEQCEKLLEPLDSEQREIAIGKLEGLSNSELAARLGCAARTIERRLDLIRRIWRRQLDVPG